MDSPGRQSGRTMSISVHPADTLAPSTSSSTSSSSSSSFADSTSSPSLSTADKLAATARDCPAIERKPSLVSRRMAKLRAASLAHHARRQCRETDHFRSWVDSFMPSAGRDALHMYSSLASLTPPISEESLKELDISSIICNARLRHDINFDRELHFRPNFDGARGKDKAQQAAFYWHALEVELEFCHFMLTAPERFRADPRLPTRLRDGLKRLPRLFATVKDILVSLMPEDDLCRVDEVLDVKLIMQAIERGVFDLPRLATWLAALLKAHCAPMRDAWVERMERHMCSGPGPDSGISESKHIVNGMKELFGILEAMKLDVANHQIRYLRPVLVANTFAFERHYFQRRICEGRFDMPAIRQWYDAATADCRPPDGEAQTSAQLDRQRFAAFATAWLHSITPQNVNQAKSMPPMPGSFKLDVERVQCLQVDVCNLLYKHICCIAYRTIAAYVDPSQRVADAADDTVMERVSAIVGRDATEQRWRAQIGNIAAELVRIASTSLTQHKAKIEGSFGVICDALEAWLSKNLQIGTAPFQQAADGLMANIVQRTVDASLQVLHQPVNEIVEALAPPLPPSVPAEVQEYYAQSGPAPLFTQNPTGGSDSLMEIVRRASQISVLHWRVWGPLLFDGHAHSSEALCAAADSTGSCLASPTSSSPDKKVRRFSICTSSPGQISDEGYGSS